MNKSVILYDTFAPYYENYSKKRKKYINSIDSILLKNIPENASYVLDVGCGDGVRGYDLFKKTMCSKITMLDNSGEMIKLAKRFESTRVEVHQANITSFKSDRKYDVIWALWNVLGHIPTHDERVQTFIAMKNCLKPSG